MRGDGRLITAGRAIAANVAGLDMCGGGDQLVAVPHARCKTGLIVRSVLARMRASVHPDSHGRTSLPCADDPGLYLARDGIGNGPHPKAERSCGDMPLSLEPANALRHRN